MPLVVAAMNGTALFVAIVVCLTVSTVTDGETAKHNSFDEEQETNTLFLLVLLPHLDSRASLNPSWLDGASVLPALQLAVEQINNNNSSSLIPRYKLELVFADGGCNSQRDTLVNLAKEVYPEDNRRLVGVVGPVCSESAAVVSSFTKQTKVSLALLHGAGSPALANLTEHPYSLGVLGSGSSLVQALLALVQMNKWKKIGVLYQESSLYYRTMFQEFQNLLPSEVKLTFLSTVTHDFYSVLKLKESKARIIFVLAAPEHGRRIICLAYHHQMIYPGYQWVMVGSTLSDLYISPSTQRMYQFTYSKTNYNCSQGDILSRTLNGSLFLHHTFSAVDRNRVTDTGISYNEFATLYRQRVEDRNAQLLHELVEEEISPSVWSSIFYDGVWMWATVLNKIMRKYQFNFTLFDYGNDTLTELIVEEFLNLDFSGVSGEIIFNSEDGFTEHVVYLAQVINSSEEIVLTFENSTLLAVDREEVIPFLPDTFPVSYSVPNNALVALFVFIVLLELIFLIVLHTLTVFYRKHKSVKASSFILNQFAFFGCYLYFLGLLLLALNYHAVGIICHTVWAWCFPIAFTIMIGTIAGRTWRLYRIFTHYLHPGPLISNEVLISFISFVVAIDVVFAIVWTVVDPLKLNVQEIPQTDGPVTSLKFSLQCTSDHHIVWSVISYSFRGLMIFMLAMLTWMTRRINNRRFATSSLQFLNYFITVVLLIGLPLYYLSLFSNPNPDARFVTENLLIHFVVCLYAVCVFVPPLIPVFREKKEKVKKIELQTSTSNKAFMKRQSTSISIFVSIIIF